MIRQDVTMEEANRFLAAAAFVLPEKERAELYDSVQNSRTIGDAVGVVDLTIQHLAWSNDGTIPPGPMVWPSGHPANQKMGE